MTTTADRNTSTPSRDEIDAIRAFTDAIDLGQPWLVTYRGTEMTAVAIKKSGGREDEIVWDYTGADGGGTFALPEQFAERFIPVAPMVPLAAPVDVAAPSGPRASDLQIALWVALTVPIEASAHGDLVADMQAVIDQCDARSDAFPAILSALLAERDLARHQDVIHSELRESAEVLIARWRNYAQYGGTTDGERALLENAANDLFDVIASLAESSRTQRDQTR